MPKAKSRYELAKVPVGAEAQAEPQAELNAPRRKLVGELRLCGAGARVALTAVGELS